MPIRTGPTPPRYDASTQRRPDPRHIFDRDPILIPSLFVDPVPRWYRRPMLLLAVVAAFAVGGGGGLLVHRHGVRGAIARIERMGVGVMYRYTSFVAGRPVQSSHNR